MVKIACWSSMVIQMRHELMSKVRGKDQTALSWYWGNSNSNNRSLQPGCAEEHLRNHNTSSLECYSSGRLLRVPLVSDYQTGNRGCNENGSPELENRKKKKHCLVWIRLGIFLPIIEHASTHCLVWFVSISTAAGLEFVITSMKTWIHPAL